MQAVHQHSQSVASTAILVTMPVTATVEPESKPTAEDELAPLAAIAPNGNGNGSTNGHGSYAGSRLS